MPSERIQRQIDRYLDEAEQAVTSLDWDLVRARAEAVLGLDPNNSDALAYLAAAGRKLPESNTQSKQAVQKGRETPLPAEDARALPASFANGRYQVKKFLGEGGKKKVYLAHDSVLDRDVAFALIKTEKLDEDGADPHPPGSPGHGQAGRPSQHHEHLRHGRAPGPALHRDSAHARRRRREDRSRRPPTTASP